MDYHLYNGKINLQFHPNRHRYTVNDRYVSGVTTILSKVVAKDGLLQWAVDLCMKEGDRRAHVKRKEAGGDVGSKVHQLIEDMVKVQIDYPESKDQFMVDDFIDSGPTVQAAIGAFLEWQQQTKPIYISSEQPVYSRQYDYAGTYDVVVVIDDKLTMLDFKTSEPCREWKNGRYTGSVIAYPEHFIQCAAYDLAYTEMKDGELPLSSPEFGKTVIEQHMVVYITKKGEHFTFINDEVEANKEAFKAALTLSRRLEKLKQ